MKITFQCTYRCKPTGYEEKSYDQNKILQRGEITDIGRTFASRHIAPTHSLILYLDSNGKLSLYISSIGSLVVNSDGYTSPWKYPMDDRIIAISITEEEKTDRDIIYSLYIDFCLNYIKNSNALLDMLEMTPDNLSCQYNIPYDTFYKTFVTDIPKLPCPKINLPPKSIVLIYSPFYSFNKKNKQNLCKKFKEVDIFLENRRIINIPENYLGVMKNTLFNYILTMINILFKK